MSNRKRGSIALARRICYQINGAADDSDDMDGGGYGSLDIAEILSAEVLRLQKALAQPEQKPVACRFCFSKKGCWTWQCYSCGEIDDVQQPAPPLPVPVQEPVAWMVYTQEGQSAFVTDNPSQIHPSQRALPLYATPPLPVQEPPQYSLKAD